MLIFLNKYCNCGKGLEKWMKSRKLLEDMYFKKDFTVTDDIDKLPDILQREYRNGKRVFIAAGGDGTVHYLLNQIMEMNTSSRRNIIIGAIGLGSSNDFHKPVSKENLLPDSIPVRLDYNHAYPHNIGRIELKDQNGKKHTKYFIMSSSVGIIASANQLFNSNDPVVKRLKSRWVTGTIWYAGLKTLLKTKNISARIIINGEDFVTEITNLSTCINPNFSGNFCYDFDITPQSDFFGIALSERMNLARRLNTITSLTRKRFSSLKNTKTWNDKMVEVQMEAPSAVEMDGEVYVADYFNIMLIQGAIKACR